MTSKKTDFQKIRALLLPVKSELRGGEVKGVIDALRQATKLVVTGQLSKDEKERGLDALEKAVFLLNGDKAFRRVQAEGLGYSRGKEKTLFRELVGLAKSYDQVKTRMKKHEKNVQNRARMDILTKGRRFIDAGDPKKAVIHFRKSARGNEKDFELLAGMGKALMEVKLYDEATDFFEMALKVRQDDVGLLNDLGTCFRNLRKFSHAEVHFREAVSLSPDNEALLFNMARNFIDGHKWGEAYDTLKKALELRPDFPQARKALKVVEKKVFMNPL